MDEPDTGLEWVRRQQLVALHLAVIDPEITLKEKIRYVTTLSDAIGRTQNKAAIETMLKKLVDADKPGVKGKSKVKPNAVAPARPDDARSYRGAGGGSPLHRSRPDPDESEH